MTESEERARQQLSELQLEHRALDEAIADMAAQPGSDELQIRRLKKRKLELKDRMESLRGELIPDLHA